MTTYLLDTNICIYILKRKPINVFEKLQLLEPGTVGISSITAAELQFGVSKSDFPEKNRSALEHFLIPLEIFDFDYKAAVNYGRIRNQLEKKGQIIGQLDMLIGAHAYTIGAVFETNNLKEFNRIEGLQTENWII